MQKFAPYYINIFYKEFFDNALEDRKFACKGKRSRLQRCMKLSATVHADRCAGFAPKGAKPCTQGGKILQRVGQHLAPKGANPLLQEKGKATMRSNE